MLATTGLRCEVAIESDRPPFGCVEPPLAVKQAELYGEH